MRHVDDNALRRETRRVRQQVHEHAFEQVGIRERDDGLPPYVDRYILRRRWDPAGGRGPGPRQVARDRPGRNAAPVTIHTTTPSATTRSGAPSTRETMTRRRASCSVASDAPTITTTRWFLYASARATRRPCDASPAIRRSIRNPFRWPWRA